MVEEWGRLDVLVNNAGIVRDAVLEDVTDEDWEATLDVNLRGAMVCTRAAVPHMLERGSRPHPLRRVASWPANGNYGQTAYAASKAGLIGMTRIWARELGPRGITANVVAPGFIDTDMVKSVPPKVVEQFARAHPRRPPRPARGGRERLPVPRLRPRVLHQRRGRGRGRRPAALSREPARPSRTLPTSCEAASSCGNIRVLP